MLFMVIMTYEPDKRNEVLERVLKVQEALAGGIEGFRFAGQWTAWGGQRSFNLVECDDPNLMHTAGLSVSDLVKLEVVPVLELETGVQIARNVVPGN